MNILKIAENPVRENFFEKMQKEISMLQNKIITKKPKLLLHSCCGPCSSSVLEQLVPYFAVTVFYDNPNIFPQEEYTRRLLEQKRLIDTLNTVADETSQIGFIEVVYEPIRFLQAVGEFSQFPEGSLRCFFCYEFRMRSAYEFATKNNFEYMTTTLSVSPHKNSTMINNIGQNLQADFAKENPMTQPVKFLCSDFKKKNGYKRSLELSEEYGLYRQWYCGCQFSLEEAEIRKER